MRVMIVHGWIASALFFAGPLYALDSVAASIEQAQAFVKRRDRRGASAVLIAALAGQPASAKSSRTRLTEALDRVARVFFTDKGQRAFESGRSMIFENPDLAATQFQASLESEDANVTVLESLAKIHLAKTECDLAAGSLAKARTVDPLATESALLELRVALCRRAPQLPLDKLRALPPLDRWQESYVQFLQAAVALDQHGYKKAYDLATRVTESTPDFPGAYFVLGRAAAELGRDPEASFRRYVTLCKGADLKMRRRFSLEPGLCSHQREVEDELAKGSADG